MKKGWRCLWLGAAITAGAVGELLGTCGPFLDTPNDSFCPLIVEVFYLGVTTGTTPTTYDPAGVVNRTQMAAFLSRSVNATLKRASRRTAMNQLWTPQSASILGATTVGAFPSLPQFDGLDVWVPIGSGSVSRVRGSDGRVLETWTGANEAFGSLIAMNRVLVSGNANPGKVYSIDPSQPAGVVTTVASVGPFPNGIAFDGARVWTANVGPPGSVSIVTPLASLPWDASTLSVGVGATTPSGLVFDGSNIWVTDFGLNTLLRLDGSGTVLQTVTVGAGPAFPGFDGTNIWVPNWNDSTLTVVRASSGAVLKTLTGNGLSTPAEAAFDGERVLVTNVGNTVSLWSAADLTPRGFAPTGGGTPYGACSDGVRFWVTLYNAGKLVRF